MAWRRPGDKPLYEPMMFGLLRHICVKWTSYINTLTPIQTVRYLPDDIFKDIFLNRKVYISFTISLKFVPKGSINNIPALVQIMAWRRPGDKPLSESMLVSLLTHVCVTRPRWVKEAVCIRIMLLWVIVCNSKAGINDLWWITNSPSFRD